MIIAINATAAFKKQRTGVEEYTYQLLKHLMMLPESRRHQFVLITNRRGSIFNNLSENFKIKQLKWLGPMWTQVRLCAEMLFNQPDALFIPVHVLPLIHPKNSVVTIHGLEYEYYPKMYPFWHRQYLCWSTKYALKNARKIIVPSENTKKDLIKLYGAEPEKIKVIYHGVEILNSSSNSSSFISAIIGEEVPYLLYLGRIEPKKNIQGLIAAFEILKEKYKIPHKLILAGPKSSFKFQVPSFKFRNDIIFTGYISEEKKWNLLKKADVFVYVSFYEGFGLPVLEAQACGAPVVASNISSLPEILKESAFLVSPHNIKEIAEAIYEALQPALRQDLIARGYENIKRFSWQKCAIKTLEILER